MARYSSKSRIPGCPPGVICMSNALVFALFILMVLFIVYFKDIMRSFLKQNNSASPQKNANIEENDATMLAIFPPPSAPNTNILLDPYAPPIRNTNNVYRPPILVDMTDVRGPPAVEMMPININTRPDMGRAYGYGSNTWTRGEYNQIGILTRIDGPESVLPLLGRPLHANRNKWQYYTIGDSNNHVKLPISYRGKSCTNEYGCDDISNGDTVYVEGLNAPFLVTIYD